MGDLQINKGRQQFTINEDVLKNAKIKFTLFGGRRIVLTSDKGKAVEFKPPELISKIHSKDLQKIVKDIGYEKSGKFSRSLSKQNPIIQFIWKMRHHERIASMEKEVATPEKPVKLENVLFPKSKDIPAPKAEKETTQTHQTKEVSTPAPKQEITKPQEKKAERAKLEEKQKNSDLEKARESLNYLSQEIKEATKPREISQLLSKLNRDIKVIEELGTKEDLRSYGRHFIRNRGKELDKKLSELLEGSEESVEDLEVPAPKSDTKKTEKTKIEKKQENKDLEEAKELLKHLSRDIKKAKSPQEIMKLKRKLGESLEIIKESGSQEDNALYNHEYHAGRIRDIRKGLNKFRNRNV